jgi:hypothetical protein
MSRGSAVIAYSVPAEASSSRASSTLACSWRATADRRWLALRLFGHAADLCSARVEDCGCDIDAHDAGCLGDSSDNLGLGVCDEGVLSCDDFGSAGSGGVQAGERGCVDGDGLYSGGVMFPEPFSSGE